jgi:hypothetical protein
VSIAMTENSGSGVTIQQLFAHVGLLPRGPVRWKTEISEHCAGIYVVVLGGQSDNCPFSDEAALKLDAREIEAERDRWLTGEVILYIGQTTKQTLGHRLHQFYIHRYGNRSPHRGGQAVHLLDCDQMLQRKSRRAKSPIREPGRLNDIEDFSSDC